MSRLPVSGHYEVQHRPRNSEHAEASGRDAERRGCVRDALHNRFCAGRNIIGADMEGDVRDGSRVALRDAEVALHGLPEVFDASREGFGKKGDDAGHW